MLLKSGGSVVGFLIGLLISIPPALCAQPDLLKLSQDPQWLALLHFQGTESTIDSSDFFLSSVGKKDPYAELKATVVAFLDKPNTRCRFPARFLWVSSYMSFENKPFCPELDAFKKEIDTQQVSMVYATSYMGNPASFFGHTLLKIKGKTDAPLLEKAINYGAMATPENGLVFLYKGVTGGYQGMVSIAPYFDTVNTYNAIENRDLWEYPLTLNADQIQMLEDHLWELKSAFADYYFFSQNCSYLLMEVLDVLFPDALFAKKFPYFTLPIDTVRILLENKVITETPIYRPSRQKQLSKAYESLSKTQKEYLDGLLYRPRQVERVLESSMEESQKAAVLETAYQFLLYQYISNNISLDEMQNDSRRLIQARQQVKIQTLLPEPTPPLVRPDQGHKSGSIGVWGGQKGSRNFLELTIRPVLHDLMDQTAGYKSFEQLNYLSTTLRWYEDKNDLSLQRFDVLDMISIVPRTKLYKPLAFQIKTGFERFSSKKSDEGSVFFISGGIGHSYPISKSVVVYGFVNAFGKAGGYLPNNALLGTGIQMGMYADFDLFRVKADIEPIWYTYSKSNTVRFQIQASGSVTKETSVEMKYTVEDNTFSNNHTLKAGITLHF